MNRFKGTKGSWQLDDYGKELVISSKVDNQHILTMRVVNSHQEKKANAQLIATAPELLEASIMVAEMLYFNKGVEIPDDAWNANVSNLWSVINKALGNE